jgi:hypothetical protein
MPSRRAIDHEAMRWSYMDQRALSRRLATMNRRDKLDAFLYYAFEVWSGREPSACGPAAARSLVAEALQKARALRFDDLDREYTARWNIGWNIGQTRQRTPPIARVTAPFIPDEVVRTGRWRSNSVDLSRVQAVVDINRSSWPSGTLNTFTQLLNPNMRNSIFQGEETRRPLITALWEFFVDVAAGTIHSAECRITRHEAVDLMRRLRDLAQFHGCMDLASSIAGDVDRCREMVLQWQTNQRLEGERLMQEAANLTRQRQGIRLIRFPKKKKEDALDDLMKDDSPRQPTIDQILGLDDDEW